MTNKNNMFMPYIPSAPRIDKILGAKFSGVPRDPLWGTAYPSKQNQWGTT